VSDATSRLRRRLAGFFLDPRVAVAAPLLVAVGAAVQMLLQSRRGLLPGGYTQYNNFIIFRQAFVHLVEGRDLYLYFPAEHFDNFLYSPTFAALMAPFAPLPAWLGLILWDLAVAGVLVAGIRSVPGLDARSRALFTWFVLPEFIGSAQHSQTNPAIVGLLLLVLAMAERRKDWAAALFLALAGYVKIFPLAAGLLFLVYPQRMRLVAWTAAWMLALAALPLLFVSPEQLAWQYGNWWRLHTTSTHSAGIGLSVAGILQSWFGLEPPRMLLLGVGGLAMLLPLTNPRAFSRLEFRAVFLGAVLMWMIAFNHLSESPTFVIAMAGIGLWYFSQEGTPAHQVLLWLAFLLVSVTYSDLVPGRFRDRYVHPYAIKALMVVVIWAVAVAELTLRDRGRRAPAPSAPAS
jgi:hypothetical protein